MSYRMGENLHSAGHSGLNTFFGCIEAELLGGEYFYFGSRSTFFRIWVLGPRGFNFVAIHEAWGLLNHHNHHQSSLVSDRLALILLSSHEFCFSFLFISNTSLVMKCIKYFFICFSSIQRALLRYLDDMNCWSINFSPNIMTVHYIGLEWYLIRVYPEKKIIITTIIKAAACIGEEIAEIRNSLGKPFRLFLIQRLQYFPWFLRLIETVYLLRAKREKYRACPWALALK